MKTIKIARPVGKALGLVLLGLLLYAIIGWAGRAGILKHLNQYYSYIVVFIGWLVIVFPASELIELYLNQREPIKYKNPGLEEAGKIIGRLERTIILVFYLGGSLEGIAFLVVAKSIYRFGELKQSSEKDKDSDKGEATFSISEYIILGSLLSYTIAILGGLLIKLCLTQLDLGTSLFF